MIFDYFQDIVCINLDISVDRRKHAEHYFNKLKIPARFYEAKKHPNGGIYGCFDSHINILKEAYAKGLDNILVFEDDFLPSASYSEEKLLKAIQFMEQNDDWDIVHLGYSVIKDDLNGFDSIFNSKYYTPDIVQYNAMCTQALCYSKRGIKKILEEYEDYIGKVHYDMFISTFIGLKNYCIVPMLFDQNFYFQYNIEPTDGIEAILRSLFPIIAFTKINYRLSVLKYWLMKYRKLANYLSVFLFSLMIYKIKMSIICSNGTSGSRFAKCRIT